MRKGTFKLKFDIKKVIFFSLLLIFIISVLPLFIIAQYTHPSADDYSYGALVFQAWNNTGSLVQAVNAAVLQTKSTYETWQGTFTGVFFMSLNPAVFSQALYALSPIGLISGFIFSNALLMKIIFVDYFGADKYSVGIICLAVLFLSVHFVYSPVQAFFWYNSAMYYTGFYILAQLMFAFTAVTIIRDKKTKTVLFGVLSAVLGFLIGGSNFVVALMSLFIMGVIFLYRFIKARKKWLIPLLSALAISASLLISVTAPGNAVRQQAFMGMNPFLAVILSFPRAAVFIFRQEIWHSAYLFAFVCITPLLYNIASRNKFSFKYPALAVAVFFCSFASTFTPNLYAMSSYGPDRVVNVNFFAMLLFLLFSIFYCYGWASVKLADRKSKRDYFGAIIICVSFFLLTAVCADEVNKDSNSLTGVSAFNSLITSEAETYRSENLERLAVYKNEEVKDARLKAFTVKPYVLFFDDIVENASDWRNAAVASYYGKNSVTLTP